MKRLISLHSPTPKNLNLGRRPGDIAETFADASKAEKELGWKAELTIEGMVRDAWRFEQLNETGQ